MFPLGITLRNKRGMCLLINMACSSFATKKGRPEWQKDADTKDRQSRVKFMPLSHTAGA